MSPKVTKETHKKVSFRSPETLLVDRFNFFSKSKMGKLETNIKDVGLEYIKPTGSLDGEFINFHIKSDGFSALTFLEHYTILGELDFEVSYKKYGKEDLSDTPVLVQEEFLRPAKHSFCLPTSTGLLSLFKRAEVSFEGYTETLSNLSTGDINYLNYVASLEVCFQGRKSKLEELSMYGLTPGFNRTLSDLTHNLGNEISELWPEKDSDKGSRIFYGKIPCFPFRLFPSWQNTRLERNLGSHMVPESGIIPPNINISVRLEVEKTIDPLFRFTSILQDHGMASNPTLSGDDLWTSWRKFNILNEDNTRSFGVMESIKPKLKSLYLVVKKIRDTNPSPRIELNFTQSYAVYRTCLHQIANSSSQVLFPKWDTSQQPNTMILGFIRDQELNFTVDDKDKCLNIALENFHRPNILQDITLYDNTQIGEHIIEGFRLTNLNQRNANESWRNYTEYLRNKGFLNVGLEQKRYFNLREQAQQTGSDGGTMNLFPIDLTAYKFTDCQTPLRLEIKLTEPKLSSNWFLVILYEHMAEARFPLSSKNQKRSFETRFIIVNYSKEMELFKVRYPYKLKNSDSSEKASINYLEESFSKYMTHKPSIQHEYELIWTTDVNHLNNYKIKNFLTFCSNNEMSVIEHQKTPLGYVMFHHKYEAKNLGGKVQISKESLVLSMEMMKNLVDPDFLDSVTEAMDSFEKSLKKKKSDDDDHTAMEVAIFEIPDSSIELGVLLVPISVSDAAASSEGEKMYILLQYIFPEKEAESILVEAREDSNPKVLKEAEGIVKYSRIRFPAKRFLDYMRTQGTTMYESLKTKGLKKTSPTARSSKKVKSIPEETSVIRAPRHKLASSGKKPKKIVPVVVTDSEEEDKDEEEVQVADDDDEDEEGSESDSEEPPVKVVAPVLKKAKKN